MAGRVPTDNVRSVLELAAGTGRVTRHLRNRLPSSVKLVAADLSPDMLEIAKRKFTPDEPVEWVVADMQQLPFVAGSFDVVVCQYGLMFPADKQRVFEEVYRVLRPGGVFLFSTWEKTEGVEIFKTIYNEHILPFFVGEDPARFLTPFSLHHPEQLERLLTGAGFAHGQVERVALQGVAQSAHDLVQGFLVTHAVGQEIADRDPVALASMAQHLEQAIIKKFNDHPVTCELIAYFGAGTRPRH